MRLRIEMLLEKILAAILAFMLLNVVWQVLSRYALQAPSTATDELSRFGLIWLGMLGAAYAQAKGLHLAIDLYPRNLKGTKKMRLMVVLNALVALFALAVMVLGGGNLTWITYQLGQTSASLQWSMAYIYAIIPFSGLLIIYFCMDAIYQWIKKGVEVGLD